MFHRIATDPVLIEQYTPKILSAPASHIQSDEVMDGPWVVVLENFVSPEECETMIQLGAVQGYEQSKDVGERKFDGTYDDYANEDRTSTNAWCTDDCYNDEVAIRLHQRMENLTHIPEINYEYFQLLRYHVGQFYGACVQVAVICCCVLLLLCMCRRER
jgi:prolyl 4-hydroxylase